MKKLRTGIIGTGAIAEIAHLPELSKNTSVELCGILSGHYENACRAGERYNIAHPVHSIEELVSLGLDCAFVLSPKQNHPEHVQFLLNSGIDVYCEKPLAMTLREADAMADLSEKPGRKLLVGFNRRFAPVYQELKSVYKTKPPQVIIAQKNRPATEYRATLENAIHMIDLMRYLCGECTSVHASALFENPYYESSCTAYLTFEHGTSGILVADRCAGQWGESIEAHGNHTSVYVNSPDSITVTDSEQSHTRSMTPLAMGWATVVDKLGFRYAIEHFIDCVLNNKIPLTNARDSYKTHELMDKILRKAGLPALD